MLVHCVARNTGGVPGRRGFAARPLPHRGAIGPSALQISPRSLRMDAGGTIPAVHRQRQCHTAMVLETLGR